MRLSFWSISFGVSDKKHRVAVALAHLAAVEPRHLLRLGQQHFRLGKNRLIKLIESPHDLAGQLDVRRLIDADRNFVGFVDRDIGRLQNRITEKTVGR